MRAFFPSDLLVTVGDSVRHEPARYAMGEACRAAEGATSSAPAAKAGRAAPGVAGPGGGTEDWRVRAGGRGHPRA
jgi:hypothetical protein